MKFKKPKFWDYKNPNIISYLLLPFSLITLAVNFLKEVLNKTKTNNSLNVKSICIGNIYIGGTGKTPICVKINKILNTLKYKTAFIKKFYSDQLDEQKILANNGKLFCEKNRSDGIKKASSENIQVIIFDDGLQDKKIQYDISFVCFNIENWIGNGLLLPAGPLRENINTLKKYDAVFLNGNDENIHSISNLIKNINPNIKIFESQYEPSNLEKFDLSNDYIAFSGIGNHNTFLKTLKKNNFKIIKNFNFPDHYNYSQSNLKKIKKTAENLNCKIITTEKDFMRLDDNNIENIDYLKVELNIKNENELLNFLINKL